MRQFTVRCQDGGPGVVKGVARLLADMRVALQPACTHSADDDRTDRPPDRTCRPCAMAPALGRLQRLLRRQGDTALTEDITAATWQRFFDPAEPVRAQVAAEGGSWWRW